MITSQTMEHHNVVNEQSSTGNSNQISVHWNDQLKVCF